MDDTSLDDFLAAESGDDDPDRCNPADTDGATAPAERAEQTARLGTDVDGVVPATTTSRWTGTEGTCAVCESETERVWESGDGLVCAACKEW